MSELKNIGFDTKCIHSGIGEYEHGPVVPPIYQHQHLNLNLQHTAGLYLRVSKKDIFTLVC